MWCFGGRFGPLWPAFGLNLGLLGASWAPFGAPFGPLGGVLALSGRALGFTLGHLGAPWRPWGLSLGPLGDTSTIQSSIWGAGASLRLILAHFKPVLTKKAFVGLSLAYFKLVLS